MPKKGIDEEPAPIASQEFGVGERVWFAEENGDAAVGTVIGVGGVEEAELSVHYVRIVKTSDGIPISHMAHTWVSKAKAVRAEVPAPFAVQVAQPADGGA